MVNGSPVSEVMVKFPSLHWNKETSLIKLNIVSLHLKTKTVQTHCWYGVLQGFVSSGLAGVIKKLEIYALHP